MLSRDALRRVNKSAIASRKNADEENKKLNLMMHPGVSEANFSYVMTFFRIRYHMSNKPITSNTTPETTEAT